MDGHETATAPVPATAPGAIVAAPQPVAPETWAVTETRQRNRTLVAVVGTAGALGALTREAVALLLPTASSAFPLSTLVINVSGSLALGLLLVLLTERFPRARLARALIGTGFLGAYTTFSTYAVETDVLAHHGDLVTAALYVCASLLGGIAAALGGVVGGRLLLRLEDRLGG